MSSIEQIPIRLASAPEMLTGQAEAVLTEIAEMLKRFLEEGREESIDLHGLPLSPADRVWLEERLGRGEVEIILQAGGRSVLTETAYPGVWKVTHRDTQDRLIAELIEVALVPAVVRPDMKDVARGYEGFSLALKNKPAGA